VTAQDPAAQDLDAAQSRLVESLGVSLRLIREASYPYSRIRAVRAVREGELATLFVKRVIGKPEQVRARLVAEGALLARLNELMPGEVVPLVATFPDQMVIVTAACRGTQFDHLICGSRLKLLSSGYRARLVCAAEMCGAWLARFHSLTPAADGELAGWFDFLDGEVEWRTARLQAIDRTNAGLYRDLCAKLQAALARAARPTGGCQVHSDFAPHNIFVDAAGRVQVLDFYASRVGHPLADVFNFLGKVASFADSPIFPRGVSEALCRAFLKGYDRDLSADRDLFRLLLAAHALSRTLVLTDGPRRAFARDRARRRYVAYLRGYAGSNEGDIDMLAPWPFGDLTLFAHA